MRQIPLDFAGIPGSSGERTEEQEYLTILGDPKSLRRAANSLRSKGHKYSVERVRSGMSYMVEWNGYEFLVLIVDVEKF